MDCIRIWRMVFAGGAIMFIKWKTHNSFVRLMTHFICCTDIHFKRDRVTVRQR